jgi:hypothetical protein
MEISAFKTGRGRCSFGIITCIRPLIFMAKFVAPKMVDKFVFGLFFDSRGEINLDTRRPIFCVVECYRFIDICVP